jgi:hypothetical protein
MAVEQVNGSFSPYGADHPREVERKLNAMGAALAGQLPGVAWQPLRLTYASTDAGLDSVHAGQTKLNRLFTQVAAATGGTTPALLDFSVVAPPVLSLLGGAPTARTLSLAQVLAQPAVVGALNKLIVASADAAAAYVPPPTKPGPGLLASDDTGAALATAQGGNPQGWSNTSFTYTPATSVASQRNAVTGPDGVTKDASTQTFTNNGTTTGYANVECGTPAAVGAGTLTGSIWLRGKAGGETVEITLLNDLHQNPVKTSVTLTTAWAKYSVVQPTPTTTKAAILGVGLRPSNFNGTLAFESAWPNLTR